MDLFKKQEDNSLLADLAFSTVLWGTAKKFFDLGKFYIGVASKEPLVLDISKYADTLKMIPEIHTPLNDTVSVKVPYFDYNEPTQTLYAIVISSDDYNSKDLDALKKCKVYYRKLLPDSTYDWLHWVVLGTKRFPITHNYLAHVYNDVHHAELPDTSEYSGSFNDFDIDISDVLPLLSAKDAGTLDFLTDEEIGSDEQEEIYADLTGSTREGTDFDDEDFEDSTEDGIGFESDEDFNGFDVFAELVEEPETTNSTDSPEATNSTDFQEESD